MIYFDNSATTRIKPQCVIDEVRETLTNFSANPGRSGHSASVDASLKIFKTRQAVNKLIDGYGENFVVFCNNCTTALNYAIFGTLVKGGNVVTTALEHNSVLRPLFELQRMGLITVNVVRPRDDGIIYAKDVIANVTPRTYLIALNAVSNVSGAVAPITEIGEFCKNRNITFMVDGAQGVGYYDYSMINQHIDILAIAPHKGLHAPQGVGILAISKRLKINPIICGGTGTDSQSVFQPRKLPEALESGTLATPVIASVEKSIAWNNSVKKEGNKKIAELSNYIIESLSKIDGVKLYAPKNTFNGIITFNVRDYGSTDVSNILDEQYDVAVRGGLHCAPLAHRYLGTLKQGAIRASLSFENTFNEVEFFIKAIYEIAH